MIEFSSLYVTPLPLADLKFVVNVSISAVLKSPTESRLYKLSRLLKCKPSVVSKNRKNGFPDIWDLASVDKVFIKSYGWNGREMF